MVSCAAGEFWNGFMCVNQRECSGLAQQRAEAEKAMHLAETTQQTSCAADAAGEECASRKEQYQTAAARYQALEEQ